MSKKMIETGKIVNIHGIRGEIKIQPWADDPAVFETFDELEIKGKLYPIEQARVHKNMVLVKLKGVDTVEQAELLRNKVVSVDRDCFDLPEGFYFIEDLIGLSVINADDGTVYGKLTDVMQTGANDVYEVTAEGGKQYYIPAIKDCVISTDLTEQRMSIRPLEGLFDA